MAAMKPALDLYIDANVILLFAFCFWRVAQAVILRSPLKHDYGLQIRLLKSTLLLTILSPLIAFFAVVVGQLVWPQTPLTVTDIAVAAYLNGSVSMPPMEFEALLNTRADLLERFLSGDAPLATFMAGVVTVGAVAFLARLIWASLKVRDVVGRSHLWRRIGRLDIRLSDTARVPFASRGILRRHVVLPSSLATRPEMMRVVIAHEFQHLRGRDVEWEIGFEFLRPLLYWNPGFHLWKRAFDNLRELSCDQRVIARRRLSPREYAGCLIDFCEERIEGHWPATMNVAFARTGSTTARRAFEARIIALQYVPGRGRAPLSFLVLCGLVALGVSLVAASVRQPGDWSHDRLMLSTIVNLERLEHRGF